MTNPRHAGRTAAWYRLAVRTAVVAGLFTLLVGALMASGHFQVRGQFPFNHPRMVALKADLDKRPQDEALKQEIRDLDLQIRERYFRQRAQSHQGAWLLLGGLVVFVVALKFAKQLSKRLPKPSPGEAENTWQTAGVGRQSVATLAIVAGCGLAVLGLLSRQDLSFQWGKMAWDAARRPKLGSSYPSPDEIAKNWASFRGPRGLGVLPSGQAPTMWDGPSNDGILWKTAVPLPGKNSPIAWGDRVFLTGATQEKRQIYCFDAAKGTLLWSTDVGSGGAASAEGEGGSVPEDTGYAAPTMVTDGKRAFAIFATGDAAAVDYQGNLLWARNLGRPESMYGYAASLAMWRNRLIVQYDQGSAAEDGKSALLALDASTGDEVWRTPRPVPNSWSSPIVIDTGNGEEIIACGAPWVIAYDPATGKEKWRAECLSGDVAPTPVYAGGLVYACQSGAVLAAIRTGGSGDVTKTNIAWSAYEGLPDTTSPVANCELVFTVTSEGCITCYDAVKGEKVWEQYTEKMFRSSPTLVGRNLYVTDTEGVTHFIEAGRAFKENGKAALGEKVETCPAFLNGRMFIRGEKNLVCIGDS